MNRSGAAVPLVTTVMCRRLVSAALLGLIGAAPAQAAICLADQYPHSCASAGTCLEAIAQDALDVNARLSLCQVHVDQDQLAEAAVVLRRGLEVCGQRRSACRTLELALSNVNELRQKQERESDPAEIRRNQEALRGYCLGPVTTERTIAACEELIASSGDDPDLHEALGRKLLNRGDPARAIFAFRKAREHGGDGDTLAASLAEAERQRAVLVDECLRDDDLQACDVALLAGAADEHRIQRQRGDLLAEAGRLEQALRAYLSAQSIRNDDADTARRIVQLDAGRFTGNRLTLYRAQADAHRALDDRAGETAALRDVLDANPGDATALRRLAALGVLEPTASRELEPAMAEPVAEPSAESRMAAATAEPDVVEVADVAAAPAETGTGAPDERTLLALSESRSEPPVQAPQTTRRVQVEPLNDPVTFANAVRPDGRTH